MFPMIENTPKLSSFEHETNAGPQLICPPARCARDELRRHSPISASVQAVICGLGPYGYVVAMQAALQLLGQLPAHLPAALRDGPRQILSPIA